MLYRVLYTLWYYQYLNVPQLKRILFPGHKSNRATRQYLQQAKQKRWVERTNAFFPYGDYRSGGTPVWYMTKGGCEALAVHRNDESLLIGRTKPPRESHAQHWLNLIDTHICMDAACKKHDGSFAISRWLNEWQPANPSDAKAQQFCLHTVLRETPKPLSCSPDAGCLIHVPETDERMVVYIEQDRNTGTGPKQIARQKMPGYCELLFQQGHQRHFPETNIDRFIVLLITTSALRMRLIAESIRERGEGADQWLLTTTEQLTPESFPYGDIFFNHNLDVGPLLKRPEQ